MKRISIHRRRYLDRRAKRFARKRNLRNRTKHKHLCRKHRPHPRVGSIGPFIELRAPIEISLHSIRRQELITFFGDIRNTLVKDRKALLIDFSHTIKFYAPGTLLLLAEMHRSISLAPDVKVRCRIPRDVKAAQVMKQVGLLELLHYRNNIEPTFPDVRHWRFASGHQVEGEKYESILGHYEGTIASALLTQLFRGLTEAMTNCHHHAYIKPREDGLDIQVENRNWWMFSQEKDGQLMVLFCDLGVGIPGSLPLKQPTVWQRVVSLGKEHSDSKVIKEAIEMTVSRTGKHYRGKGLKQLIEAIQGHAGTEVNIFSNRGCYTWINGTEKTRDYGDSIMGTLISWRIPIVQRSLF